MSNASKIHVQITAKLQNMTLLQTNNCKYATYAKKNDKTASKYASNALVNHQVCFKYASTMFQMLKYYMFK